MQSNSSDYCIRRCNVEIFIVFDPELEMLPMINTRPLIKKKLKKFLSELKKN